MLHHWADVVAHAERHHLQQAGWGVGRAAGDRAPGHDQVERTHLNRLKHSAELVQPAAGSKGGHHRPPIEGMVHGVDHQVKPAGQVGQVVERFHLMGSETLRLLGLGQGGGERRDFTAPGPGELQGHMAQTTNSDHGHMVRG